MARRRQAPDERRRLARRHPRQLLRSSATAIVLVAAVVAAITYSAVARKRARPPALPPPSLGAGTSVVTARLPSAGLYQYLSTAGGQLVLSGGPGGSPLALTPAAPARGRCRSARVNPRTLALSRQMVGMCRDPRTFSARVLPLEQNVPGVANASTLRVTRAIGQRTTTSPVLLRYTDLAGTEPEAVYGGGYLWIYVPLAAPGATVLAVSETTGRVAKQLRAPDASRPLLLANDYGLWFAAQTSLGPALRPGLYHLAPTSDRPVLVVATAGARWLAGWRQTVWLGAGGKRGTRVFQLTGDHVSHEADLQPSPGSPALGPGAPAGTNGYAGTAGGRVWGVTGGPCARSVIEIDPAEGTYRAVASVPAPPGCLAGRTRPEAAPLVGMGKYLYLLQPWGGGRFGALYRLGPSSG